MVRAALVAIALTASGCGWLPTRVETITVKVPVEVARTPPADLAKCTDNLEAPTFVAPADPAAAACLVPSGAKQLIELVDQALTCEAAWETWANDPGPRHE